MKKGFTLVEVLITIGIIGVIAAITIPILLAHSNRTSTIEKLKNTQSTLARAAQGAVTSAGGISNWNWESATPEYMMENYFLPNMYVARNCGFGEDALCTYEYKTLTPGETETTGNADWYKVFLNDGTLVAFTLKDKTANAGGGTDPDDNGEIDSTCPKNRMVMCGMFIVDVNGKNRPNQVGWDIFYFGLYSNGSFLPYGGNWDEDKIDAECKNSASGKTCAAKVAKDGWSFCSADKCGANAYPLK